MNEEILEKYYRHLCGKYRSKHTRQNNLKYTRCFLQWLQQEKNKTYIEITPDDTMDYKIYCYDNFKQNGNVGRLNGLNNFVDGFLNKPDLRVTAPKSIQVNKVILNDEELERYINSADTPLERLIAVYQVDGLLRPGEFANLKISLHDIENQIVYIDQTKTGNRSIIFTPRMIKVYNNYLKVRVPPKNKEHNDHLMIIDKGSSYGKPITFRADFIWRHTKQIAFKADFTRSVYPYLIKSSAITESFNKQINPKIIQRQARHKRIETTLRYDHTTDRMAKEYFNKAQGKINNDSYNRDDNIGYV
jgi:integrase